MASLRYKYYKYNGKPAVMKDMTEGYDPYMLDIMRIYAYSWEAVTSKHIARCWKSCGMIYLSDVADLTQLYGKK